MKLLADSLASGQSVLKVSIYVLNGLVVKPIFNLSLKLLWLSTRMRDGSNYRILQQHAAEDTDTGFVCVTHTHTHSRVSRSQIKTCPDGNAFPFFLSTHPPVPLHSHYEMIFFLSQLLGNTCIWDYERSFKAAQQQNKKLWVGIQFLLVSKSGSTLMLSCSSDCCSDKEFVATILLGVFLRKAWKMLWVNVFALWYITCCCINRTEVVFFFHLV